MNEKAMQTSHGSSLSYNPCLPEWITIELEAKAAIEHYGLDTSYGWTITRAAYPWKGKRRPSEIKALSLTMEKRPYTLAGPHFKVNGSGDTVYTFTHPLTGIQYTLSVLDIEQFGIGDALGIQLLPLGRLLTGCRKEGGKPGD